MVSRTHAHLLMALLCALGAAALFLTAPRLGEFWWSDAPRHALNAVFVRDLLAARPADPAAWAMQYYVQYPALTILFYPPLFYAFGAAFVAALGVSHATLLVAVLAHYVALAFGLYILARRFMGAGVAMAVGLSIMAVPGVALWGRQVMLEVPALAFAVWGMAVLRAHAGSNRPLTLYLGAFLLLCAVYTKISAAFLFPVAAAMLLAAQGTALWRRLHNYAVAGLVLLGLVPLALLTLEFGAANVQSVVGIADRVVGRDSIAGWLWYAHQVPGQLGWPLLAASLLGVVTAVLRRRAYAITPQALADLALLLGWVVVGYVFFSFIDLKEARHSTLILPPLLVMAGIACHRLLPARPATVAAFLLVLGTGAATWRLSPVPQVAGYRDAALWIAQRVPRDEVIVFSGNRDGSFVFNMRTLEDRRDIITLRADKLLLDVAVRRELGVAQRDMNAAEIGAMFDRLGVRYVVAQSAFWVDLPVMAALQDVLRGEQFEEVGRIPVVANVPTEDKELRIFRNRHEVAQARGSIILNLPIIGRSVEGTTGAR
jgi:hypothetical protein